MIILFHLHEIRTIVDRYEDDIMIMERRLSVWKKIKTHHFVREEGMP
ncbi:hypothetical protein [Bacillus sp. I-2]|nr:hypothetical protein [Bacillus sp. I-2]